MRPGEVITVSRDLLTTQIPSGIPHPLAAGSKVRLTQALCGSYTVMTDHGYMLRVDPKGADAIGRSPEEAAAAAAPKEFSEALVWDQLRTVYDPEIPVNVVELGLIYDCQIKDAVEGPEGKEIDIKMTMTAPGCGMADVLKSDIERRLLGLPAVKNVKVEVVFDPPWHPGRMSEAARLQLGLDLDPAAFPMYGRY